MTQSSSRSASPTRAAAPVVASNGTDRNHNQYNHNHNDVAASSVQHFTATTHNHDDLINTQAQKQREQQQQRQQQQQQQQQQMHNGSYGHKNNTEAASRMIAEENHQRNKLPVLPGLEQYTLLEKMGE